MLIPTVIVLPSGRKTRTRTAQPALGLGAISFVRFSLCLINLLLYDYTGCLKKKNAMEIKQAVVHHKRG
jgi:hypothetical protein